MVKVYANAKINLALEVMDTVDGYHLVNNIMIPISLSDELIVEENKKEIVIENCDIKDNICYKAAALFLEHFNINSYVTIRLNKNIPVAAGLAGGSTDGAFTLIALNKLFNVGATNEELKMLASKLGSDVPFFIDNEVSLCTHRGEIVNSLKLKPNKINLLIIKPKTSLSTALVYKNYEYKGVSKKEEIDGIIEALRVNDIKKLDSLVFNDLEAVALRLNSELKAIYDDLSKNYNVHVSGSGPSMFILNPTDDDVKLIKEKYNDIFVERCYTIG